MKSESDSTSIRKAIEIRQAELLDSLVNMSTVPDGFDGKRVELSAQTLRSKRLRTISRMHPWLAPVLGERLYLLFDDYCKVAPAIPAQGARADAAGFLSYLQAKQLVGTESHAQRIMRSLRNGLMKFIQKPIALQHLSSRHQ